jgi:hypothetical protein
VALPKYQESDPKKKQRTNPSQKEGLWIYT